jgi:hypothetical protein
MLKSAACIDAIHKDARIVTNTFIYVAKLNISFKRNSINVDNLLNLPAIFTKPNPYLYEKTFYVTPSVAGCFIGSGTESVPPALGASA